jgi:hypothetical protein
MDIVPEERFQSLHKGKRSPELIISTVRYGSSNQNGEKLTVVEEMLGSLQ